MLMFMLKMYLGFNLIASLVNGRHFYPVSSDINMDLSWWSKSFSHYLVREDYYKLYGPREKLG